MATTHRLDSNLPITIHIIKATIITVLDLLRLTDLITIDVVAELEVAHDLAQEQDV